MASMKWDELHVCDKLSRTIQKLMEAMSNFVKMWLTMTHFWNAMKGECTKKREKIEHLLFPYFFPCYTNFWNITNGKGNKLEEEKKEKMQKHSTL